uniref:Uncharacterized protein n=1 Tax=Branchiostoma floridae TaxID=7739 RepID=C3YZ65_BRAFL|eukprot:XP_002598561.1 hypothetical protein BRAFLDRAFT_66952 [Branchiostoma floridae]
MDPENMNSVKQGARFYEATESRKDDRKQHISSVLLLLFVLFSVMNAAGYMHLAMRLAHVEGQLANSGHSKSETDGQQHVIEQFDQNWEQPANKKEQTTGALKSSTSPHLNLGRMKRAEHGSSEETWEVRLYHPKSGNGKRHKRHHDMAKGVVEVKIGGKWGRICDRNWGLAEANVVCRHLGHDGATRSYKRAAANYGQYFSPHFSLSDVECRGTEQSLQECQHIFDITLCEGKSRSKLTAGVKCAVTDECASSPCKNGGTCRDGQDRYTCDCPPGWEGVNCDREINKCASSPCKNNATCQGGQYEFSCHCAAGWEGQTCEINTDECVSSPCQNSGLCEDRHNGYTCVCTPGWEGLNCEIEVNECLPNPCQNSGECHDLQGGYRCDCQPGWEGPHCEISKTPYDYSDECETNPCENNATCVDGVNNYSCVCTPGWEGHDCDIPSNRVLAGHWDWEKIPTNKFHFDHGKLEILEEGDYYIYSQVHFINNEKVALTTNYTVKVVTRRGQDDFLTCVHEMYGFPPYKTCFTAGMRKLHKKDVVYLYAPCDHCVISLDHDTTFFGVMKIN